MGNPGQAEARLLARTDVDARRELHNGTNNAGDIINSAGNAFIFPLKKSGFCHVLGKQMCRKNVELILSLFRVGSGCRGGEKTFVGGSDRGSRTIFGGAQHQSGVAVFSGCSCLATETERPPSCSETVQPSTDRCKGSIWWRRHGPTSTSSAQGRQPGSTTNTSKRDNTTPTNSPTQCLGGGGWCWSQPLKPSNVQEDVPGALLALPARSGHLPISSDAPSDARHLPHCSTSDRAEQSGGASPGGSDEDARPLPLPEHRAERSGG